ncbi:tRNA pseudouridine(55) synthase TruB [Patescibacteria group bacterium]|nr:tRNA pseudouridine(55) synthase TruB [Patescibacteria group bacterium]
MKLEQDIILIDKPKGISSFDVIRILRKKLNIKKIGHAGTLDPLATGLLILGVGLGTKKLSKLIGLDKVYEMDILLGKQTTTGDLEGEILKQQPVVNINKKEVKKILATMIGEIELPVPIYSALKLKGRPLYKYARQGIKVDLPNRKTTIYDLKFLGLKKDDDFYILKVVMKCSKGTYARSIAEEIGRKLNCPACLAGLRRTKVGDFNLSQAQKI